MLSSLFVLNELPTSLDFLDHERVLCLEVVLLGIVYRDWRGDAVGESCVQGLLIHGLE